MPSTVFLIALDGLPAVAAGDDLAGLVLGAAAAAGIALQDGDILVFAQKIVSKAEGRLVDLASVTVTAQAADLARVVLKEPALVALVLAQTRRIVRAVRHVLIVRHVLGHTMANAGIDQSNVAQTAGSAGQALLLPEDPDASATRLRTALEAGAGCQLGVVISDSFGRPWRRGTVGVAIGAAGLPSLVDLRGQPDMFGRALQVTEVAFADEVAAAASLLMGQAGERRPVVVVRGLRPDAPHAPAAALVRPDHEDLFL